MNPIRIESIIRQDLQSFADSAWGIYVHIPFCHTVCPYCDFAVVNDRAADHERYLVALGQAIRSNAERPRARTIYLGGGTPTRLRDSAIAKLVQLLFASFGEPVECTLEANIEDLTRARLDHWRQAGITRLSIGLQRLDREELRRLGRARSFSFVAGLPQLLDHWQQLGGTASIDLLYGVHGEHPDRFFSQVETVLDWPVQHLSAYALTVEPETPYATAVRKGILNFAEDEVLRICYLGLIDRLESRGWHAYDVSNFAMPGHHSRHNRAYWEGRPYLGFGLGAASFVEREGVWSRFRRPDNWADFVAAPTAEIELELQSLQRRIGERLLLGLRSDVGVPSVYLEAWQDVADSTLPEQLLDQGDLVRREGRVHMPPRARLLAEEVAARWWADLERGNLL